MHCLPAFFGPEAALRKHWSIWLLTFHDTQAERLRHMAQHAAGSWVPFTILRIGFAAVRQTPCSIFKQPGARKEVENTGMYGADALAAAASTLMIFGAAHTEPSRT